MGRWVAFFVFVFICGNLVAGAVDTQAVYAVTRLDSSISESDVTVTVDETTNFPSSGYIYIGTELIAYTGKTSTTFTGCARGYTDPQTGKSTEAASHGDDSKTMSIVAKTMSGVGAINLVTSGVTFGSLAAYVITGTAISDIAKTLTWDYPWFQGNMVYARLPLFALSAGFLWALGLVFLTIAQGILRIV